MPFDRPLEGQGATLSDNGNAALTGDDDTQFESPALSPIGGTSREEAGNVLRQELYEHRRAEFFKAKLAQILVEVAEPGR